MALDARNGHTVWSFDTVPLPAREHRRSLHGAARRLLAALSGLARGVQRPRAWTEAGGAR